MDSSIICIAIPWYLRCRNFMESSILALIKGEHIAVKGDQGGGLLSTETRSKGRG